MTISSYLGTIVGSAIIPLMLSLICLALVRPKSYWSAFGLVGMVVVLELALEIMGGGTLAEINLGAVALTFTLAIVAYYLARRIWAAIVSYELPSAGRQAFEESGTTLRPGGSNTKLPSVFIKALVRYWFVFVGLIVLVSVTGIFIYHLRQDNHEIRCVKLSEEARRVMEARLNGVSREVVLAHNSSDKDYQLIVELAYAKDYGYPFTHYTPSQKFEAIQRLSNHAQKSVFKACISHQL